ncbi:MAG: DUF3786 domain-containing protein [Nitrospirae bacterium]|nr:DUF3786 domain-containing protein [Nitrospirota bacterium]
MLSGETKAWETLSSLEALEVCKRTGALFDVQSGAYTLVSLGCQFRVDTATRTITGISPGSQRLLSGLGDFFRLSALWYLSALKDISITGEWISPENMREGQIFFKGSHVLPLNKLATGYGNDRDGFLKKGLNLGGRQVFYGDAAVELLPFPKLSVMIILWLADDEFPPRATLLFDSSSEFRLPVDILWYVAMISVLMMTF